MPGRKTLVLNSVRSGLTMKLVPHFLLVLMLFHGIARVALASSATEYLLGIQNLSQQTGSSTFVGGFGTNDQYSLNAFVQTGGADLSAAPILGLPVPTNTYPSGSITFPTGTNISPTWPTGNGYDEYKFGEGWTSEALLNSVYGSGNFTFTIGNATAQPILSMNTASPTFPISPTLTSGGTWSGGVLVVDPTVTNTLTFNTSAFTGYSSGLGGQISFKFVDSNLEDISTPELSQNVPDLGIEQPALTSFTIAAGTLVAGQTYTLQTDYTQVEQINTQSFTGTGITGSPVGISYYQNTTFITILAQGSQSQTITFPPIATQQYPGPTVALSATASSELPVTYTVTSGPGTVSGSTLTLTGVGLVTVTASQAGNASYQAAPSQSQTVTVTSASPQTFAQWETYYGISGEPPTAMPENDGVPLLLKYLDNLVPTSPMSATERSALPTVGMTTVGGTRYLTLTYTEYLLETGITVNVQTSPDLQTWTTVSPPDFAQQVGTDSNNDPIIEVGVVYNGNKQFIRVNVTQP